jgi:NADPH:quinone reductase-like Zn-dependent oxidoreductase
MHVINLPDRMTAAVTMGHGGPEMVEIHHDWPRPRPSRGEVLIRVAAAGINNTDIWTREGAYGSSDDPDATAGWRGHPLEFPRIQGADIVGEVVDLGSDASENLLGRRVIVDPAAEYDEWGSPSALVGSEVDGGFGEFHVSAVDRVHDVTNSPLSDAQLACLPIAYATALGMIGAADCRQHERVLVTGASGGVGLAAVQLLAHLGCRVIAYTTEAKSSVVTASGADEILIRGQDRLGDSPEVDVVLDVVGGPEFSELVSALHTGGRLAVVGAIAGPLVQLDLRQIYLRQRHIIGSTMHTKETFRRLVELAGRGAVSPVVAETFPLSRFAAAQAAFVRKDFVGKLVLWPDRASSQNE